MAYPSLEQYNEAFQFPRQALNDTELKQASVTTTGLGVPLALCGGFALTYTLKAGSKKYAVRCFHKQSPSLEKRYIAISSQLARLKSPYFVDFEFQPKGVTVTGQSYPVVKMAWASGTTLGQFLEANYKNSLTLGQLRSSLQALSQYLESQSMAHGDISAGNVMVSDSGRSIQLIDYDGMYVPNLKQLGSAELGHRNFQHPKRSHTSWAPSIDRFSFIGVDLALRALETKPELWTKTQSDGDCILFKANDFVDPSRSVIFDDLFRNPKLAQDAKNFAAICKSEFDKTPTLGDFLSKKNIPLVSIELGKVSQKQISQYLSAYPVLDATNYMASLSHVGDKVELIGRIIEVKEDTTRQGKPYVFINFGPWKGSIVKISIWSEGLDAISNKPGQSWVGKWVSVVGLMEPPYVSKRYSYSHLSISITQGNQLHLIAESEAKFRLAGSSTRSNSRHAVTSNHDVLDKIHGNRSARSGGNKSTGRPSPSPAITPNAVVLDKMRRGQSSPQTGQPSSRHRGATKSPSGSQRSTPSSSSGSYCFIATAVYGINAPETNALRNWRDRSLVTTTYGRAFVSGYYAISPKIVPLLERLPQLKQVTKYLLDLIVVKVTQELRPDSDSKNTKCRAETVTKAVPDSKGADHSNLW